MDSDVWELFISMIQTAIFLALLAMIFVGFLIGLGISWSM